ncbi:MAG: response regulator [Blastocatellia bacterium]
MQYTSTILIVDDELGGRKNLEGLLIGHGYNLIFANSGLEALDKASELFPDLILLDVMMPGIDGFEVCRRVRSEPLLAEVPIIMVTALDDRSFRLQGIESGADDFISKPFDRVELRTRVKSILRLNRYRKLLLQKANFEKLIELSPNGIVIVNVLGIIQLANPKIGQILSLKNETELLGKEIFEFIALEQKEIFLKSLEDVIKASKQIKHTEITMVRSNKMEFPAELDADSFIWEGETATQIIIRDITEKKMLETQIFRTQRLENIGALASGVAHDLNNILSPILMSIGLLRKRIPDEKSNKLLNLLEETTNRGAELVKQVLSFGRGLESKCIVINIKTIIMEIEKILKETFPRLIKIKVELEGNLWSINANTTQIHQILMNLCINARDAIAEEGTICISASNLFVDDTYVQEKDEIPKGFYVVISVADTGIGMSDELIEKIYEPFFTTKDFGKGTGLGLSTVSSIVKNHEGFIKVNSQIGKGTEFKVYLPAAKTVESQQVKKEITKQGNGELILLVDDEASIREITKTSLEVNNYRVIMASDGIEAITLFLEHKIELDLVIIDLIMPVLDGSKTILALKKISPSVNIIVSSGNISEKKIEELKQLGINKFLLKPYTVESLLDVIQNTGKVA